MNSGTGEFYEVRTLIGHSPDKRCLLETALARVADALREDPTVPADPQEASAPWAAAVMEDTGVVLPPKHCSFRGCLWWGEKDDELLSHLIEKHQQTLWSIVRLLPEERVEEEQVWAVYCESVAWQVRKGAPLASYAIDRRAMATFAAAVEGDNIQELVCFSCARRFARVETGDEEDISWNGRLFTAGVVGSRDADVRFCGLTMCQTAAIFGFEARQRNSHWFRMGG